MLHNPPPKYQEMFTMNGDQLFSWPCFRLYPCKPTSARFISADTEQLIRKYHSDRSQLNVTLCQKTEEVAHTRDDIKKKTEVALFYFAKFAIDKFKITVELLPETERVAELQGLVVSML